MSKNYFDENGNYINVENKSLAEIYMEGRAAAAMPGPAGLQHCPFCGQTEHLTLLAEGGRDDLQHQVVCAVLPDGTGGCGASCGWQESAQEAIAAWNRRC